MGKYMRKAKITADIAVMEVSQSSFGVRTRAKTLALQRQQSATTTPPTDSDLSYLQLRSRRLEKPSLQSETKKNQPQQTAQNENCKQSPSLELTGHGSRLRMASVISDSVGSVSISRSNKELGLFHDCSVEFRNGEKTEDINNFSVEASFGDNNLEIEGKGRSTRESTPCSFMPDSDTVATPSSTTKPISARILNSLHRNSIIPTARDMEEFFASAEQQHQRLFNDKYNFDFVNDLPLQGRYEWMRVEI